MSINALSVLKTAIREMGYPTTGETACLLWEYLSGDSIGALPTKTARDIYEDLGYVPFAGYPLKRANVERDAAEKTVRAVITQEYVRQLDPKAPIPFTGIVYVVDNIVEASIIDKVPVSKILLDKEYIKDLIYECYGKEYVG